MSTVEAARRRKGMTCPELSGDDGRARLVLAAEVGGPSSSPSWPKHACCPFLKFGKVGFGVDPPVECHPRLQ